MYKLLLAFFVTSYAASVCAQEQDPIIGLWQSPLDATGSYYTVNMIECGDNICGVVQDVVNASTRDASLVAGRMLIRNMAAYKNGRYRDGFIWNPEDKKNFKLRMSFRGERLLLESCDGALCGGETWTRLQ